MGGDVTIIDSNIVRNFSPQGGGIYSLGFLFIRDVDLFKTLPVPAVVM